jgi:hypothetical protein
MKPLLPQEYLLGVRIDLCINAHAIFWAAKFLLHWYKACRQEDRHTAMVNNARDDARKVSDEAHTRDIKKRRKNFPDM